MKKNSAKSLPIELPREIQPGRDLWPGIESRLTPRDTAVVPVADPVVPIRRWTARQWGFQALAALLFMALGASVTYWSLVAGDSAPPARTADGETADRPPAFSREEVPGSRVRPVAATPDGATSPGGELERIEADYLRARDALWLRALQHRESYPPGTLEVVEKNMELLELAIRDLRRALELDPGNPELERRLRAGHRRSIEVLQRIAWEA